MPSAPNLDGLPLWLQIGVTLLFGFTTFMVAYRGYSRKPQDAAALLGVRPQGDVAQVQSAAIMDIGAIRHLSDVCIRLTGQMESLEQCVRDQTHWTRNQHELDREIAGRLRELREILERRPI